MLETIIKPLLIVCGFHVVIIPFFLIFLCASTVNYVRTTFTKSRRFEGAKQENPKCIVITGAASGIGRQLAIDYAKKYPFVKLGLIVRKMDERAASVKRECEEHSASVVIRAIDVANRAAIESFIEEFDKDNHIDLVVANAGVTQFTLSYDSNHKLSSEFMDHEVFSINLMGVLNVIIPSITRMKSRNHGTVVIISSQLAHEPTLGAYSCAKNAIANYGRHLRVTLAKEGIAVINVLPGWVQSQMADRAEGMNKFGIISTEEATSIILRGVENNAAEIIFPVYSGIFPQILHMIPFEWKKWLLPMGTAQSVSTTKSKID